jgi:hypothetical protein
MERIDQEGDWKARRQLAESGKLRFNGSLKVHLGAGGGEI